MGKVMINHWMFGIEASNFQGIKKQSESQNPIFYVIFFTFLMQKTAFELFGSVSI